MLSIEDEKFVDRVFRVLDDDGSGTIEWEEFIEALSSLEKGSREKRTGFLFQCYDEDDDGEISAAELYKFFLSSLRIRVTPYISEVRGAAVGPGSGIG